ncbi:hypothetical protein CGRA01v4_01372 [Colletotrichum graminicola]|nr:hypothetical protein CGRA01v4_01372 [Colletotrichum graminicola]
MRAGKRTDCAYRLCIWCLFLFFFFFALYQLCTLDFSWVGFLYSLPASSRSWEHGERERERAKDMSATLSYLLSHPSPCQNKAMASTDCQTTLFIIPNYLLSH